MKYFRYWILFFLLFTLTRLQLHLACFGKLIKIHPPFREQISYLERIYSDEIHYYYGG